MLSEKSELLFDDEDIRMMTAFNVFCGISLYNAKLYQASLDLSKQLTIFTEMSSAIKEDSSDQTLKSIIMNAKNTLGASGAVLYIYNSDDKSFQVKDQVGKGATNGTTFAEKEVQDREDKIFQPDDIYNLLFPAQSNNNSKLGKDDPDDSFDSISSRPITHTKPGKTGSARVSMLLSTATTAQLPDSISSIITNEKFFRFLYAIRSMYKKVPYHNWRHAVDVTQFVTYQIMISGHEKVFTKFEFNLVVAAICRDANHDGFTNIYNIKAETPLGILYKNQSVMETHHCSIAIQIMSHEETNLLATLNQDECNEIWSLIIQYILATDMARHFEILKRFIDIYDDSDFTTQRHDHRVMLLYMILKCGDISNVSRPFELVDRWCDYCLKNDRSHLDKAKSQIDFYTFVTLPMFQAAVKAVPALNVNMRQALSFNLEEKTRRRT
ncbi:3'5'-cyclic nucleotide phosphodiesterase family protein [Trichomonas vaginalis G3]|uniref:3'5'-cyclic nucleotide phosphodiesterase family protein n=1 Tax=Trichomonas vaginalis (strain ATCC PRA-98 / G3) TaxID=412133 RepID=A2E0V4_TRIV3|nr:3',5'-cyclic-nucleotide phosphodiesterase protein [Trichomonas vaginalis G3]EAY13709.1 3'5'-cyclic nucleotide phosphodiesterase family protein [Trichomonas vaginalis G3]KAI5529641.1 3',5'-cyclic-nucleotide phosphodiesterase protein [Trichomonas vaginalis G3]|eukprot:XP_001325932.1 3'5'-cyclic nucleotide phosphodiesterase family protein [Trichomonas vaginalis G3]